MDTFTFITVAEKTGLIYDLRKYIVREVFSQINRWKMKGIDVPIISINISSKSFERDDIAEYFQKELEAFNLKGEEIVLEVTESSGVKNLEDTYKNMMSLKELGLKIALDDFGTGYSSLARLSILPIDYVKLDREFIQGITNGEEFKAVVNTMVYLTTILDMKIVAEGIETKEQLDILKEIKMDLGQGYYLARPMPPKELEKFIRNYGKEEEDNGRKKYNG